MVVPNWSFKTLSEIIKNIKLGGNYKNSETITPYPLIKMGNLSRGHINLDKIEYIQETIPSDDHLLKKGDILFNTRNTPELVGKVAIWKNELPTAFYNSNIMRIEFTDAIADNFFVNYLFNTTQMVHKLKDIAIGTTSVAAIYTRDLYALKVLLPTKLEQKAIAEALSDTDSLIASLEKLIAKKKAIKQGAMQELLTGKKRLPGFSGEWKPAKLGDICTIVSGGTPATSVSDYWGGSIQWCTPTDITSCKSKRIYRTFDTITKKGLCDSSATLLPPNSLLLCSRATIGEVRIAGTSIATNQGFKSLISNFNISHEWLYYLILTLRPQMLEKAIGSTFLEISKKDLASINLAVPTEKEQASIATILSDMDAEIDQLEKKAAKYRQIKQGMMQELLTGRIQLV